MSIIPEASLFANFLVERFSCKPADKSEENIRFQAVGSGIVVE
jgi:hypothetical protein